MPSRARAGTLVSAVVIALCGCKERSDAARPLPAPEPPATAGASPPRDEAPVKKRPAVIDEDRPSAKPATEPRAPSPSPATTGSPEPTNQAGTASGGAAAAPTGAPSAPAVSAPSPACLSRCQGALQGCLSQPVDGGVPGFANLELCKKAFEACQAACKP